MSYQNTYAPTANEDLFRIRPPQYAGFWQRFAAALIDGIILMIPNVFLTLYADAVWSNLLSILIYWMYDALQESGNMQATIGKRALGIKVTTENGERISFGQATGRHFGKFVSAIILLIGYLMMLWDDKKQTLHDKMASTLVVQNEPVYV